MTEKDAAHQAALDRAGNVLAWATTNSMHPDATLSGRAEQITAMYLRELARGGSFHARAILDRYFPAHRR
jgi:hypothetical protein